MFGNHRIYLLVFLLALSVGAYFALHEKTSPQISEAQGTHQTDSTPQKSFQFEASSEVRKGDISAKTLPIPSLTRASQVRPHLSARSLKILRPDGTTAILADTADEGGPGLWLLDSNKRSTVNLGVHGNGFPFVLVSDGSIRNFGLGRVDGRNASPILVFRSNDIVKMVFGLSMTERGQPPFLVHYSDEGKKNVLMGDYCDAPSRACTQ